MRYRRGLVVGKFSPLHLGHEYLIDQALAACEELFILAYSQPAFARCGVEVRERWLRQRFPDAARIVVLDDVRLAAGDHERRIPPNSDPDDVQREFVGWVCQEVITTTVDVVFTSEDYGDGFASTLAAYFRAHVPGYVGEVAHVCVDKARTTIPVSATRIRADAAAARQWLSPAVHADFVRRTCILGGESTGKSTLAVALASHLGSVHAAEYGRELWEAKDGALTYTDMLHIGQEQCAREDALAREALGWLICDTSPLTTMFYSHALFGQVDPGLVRLAERRYDLVLLCEPDFPFVQDGTRQNEAFRDRQHAWYVAELTRRRIPFGRLGGKQEQRVTGAILALAAAANAA